MISMEEFPEFDKEDSTLAALGYLPFFLISIIVPIYVLAKKEGQYARFHAMQSLALTVVVFVLSTILSILAFLLVALFVGGALFSSESFATGFFAFYGGLFIAMIPSMIFSLVKILLDIYLAISALNGTRVKLPVITSFVLKRL